jgi:Asp-tRNA(Asn)/Glu-tRNA(Gln) amidotransferase C subunit
MEKGISLCMIVKNEEDFIKNLGLIKDYVDEMIVVDTGSVGKTIHK